MTKGEDFKLLKIQTGVLKVNIHCDGCKQKVKKSRQQAAADAKKGAISSAAFNNASKNCYKGKKGGPNQNNVGNKATPSTGGGLDQKSMAALKMNNNHLSNGEKLNLAYPKRANDIGNMMSLAGFHSNNNPSNPGSANVLGNNFNGFVGSSPGLPNNGVFPASGHHHHHHQYSSPLMNMNGFCHNQASSLMNMNMMNMQQQARHGFQQQQQQQQPQLMYQRSPIVTPNTGCYCYNNNNNHHHDNNNNNNYYNYNYAPPNYLYALQPNYYYYTGNDRSAAHMFSDDNTSSSCSIM